MPAANLSRIATRATVVNPFTEDFVVITRHATAIASAVACCAALLVAGAVPAHAASAALPTDPTAPSLDNVINAMRLWAVGALAALGTLMLTVAGILYVIAGGNPTQIEKAKGAFKAALGGYALALLAPLLMTIVKSLVGGS